jgi:hypothetical protein
MFKNSLNSGKFVGVLGMFCGRITTMFTVVEFDINARVGKTTGFKQVYTAFTRFTAHSFGVAFQSVLGVVFPAFHNTYNKLLLFKLTSN